MLNTLQPSGRVRVAGSRKANEQIDRKIEASVYRCARSMTAIETRLDGLEDEWDIERTLEANASTLALTGVLLGALVGKRWLWLPGVVATLLLQHALQGWCPPVEVFRRMGVRTRGEIDTEKYALKALRGDFQGLDEARDDGDRARRALAAVRRNGSDAE